MHFLAHSFVVLLTADILFINAPILDHALWYFIENSFVTTPIITFDPINYLSI